MNHWSSRQMWSVYPMALSLVCGLILLRGLDANIMVWSELQSRGVVERWLEFNWGHLYLSLNSISVTSLGTSTSLSLLLHLKMEEYLLYHPFVRRMALKFVKALYHCKVYSYSFGNELLSSKYKTKYVHWGGSLCRSVKSIPQKCEAQCSAAREQRWTLQV